MDSSMAHVPRFHRILWKSDAQFCLILPNNKLNNADANVLTSSAEVIKLRSKIQTYTHTQQPALHHFRGLLGSVGGLQKVPSKRGRLMHAVSGIFRKPNAFLKPSQLRQSNEGLIL